MEPVRLFVLALAAALPASAAPPAAPPEVAPLDGAFIQFHTGNLDADWTAAFESLTALGMDTLILQYLRFNDTNFLREANDPTRRILELADARNRAAGPARRVRVFLGLALLADWDGGRGRGAEGERRRTAVRAACLETAEQIQQRYGRHDAFAGWYIPVETDNVYDPDDVATLDAVHDLFRDIAQGCRRLADKPVALSAYFNTESWCAGPDRTERAYARLLAGGHIRYLLLQDGVGERGWDGRVRERIDPFFAAFGRACAGAGTELWAVAECFRLLPKGDGRTERRVPVSDVSLLEAQLQAIRANGVKTAIAFEFYAYLDPAPHGAGDPGQELRRALYEGYRRNVVLGGRP